MKWLYRPRSIHPPPPLTNEAFVPVQPSLRHAHFLAKEGPNKESPPFSVSTSRGDVSSPALSHDQRVYVTEAPQIPDLDHSSRFKSETYGEISDGGTPGKNDESDVSRTIDSDVNSRDMSVRRPLRPW